MRQATRIYSRETTSAQKKRRRPGRREGNRNSRGYPKSLAMSSGFVKDIGDKGGYSPSATASSCENGGNDPGRANDVVNGGYNRL